MDDVRAVLLLTLTALVVGAGCKTVTRTPVAFATESYHARDNELYRFGGWVSGEFWAYTLPFVEPAQGGVMRAGDIGVPRSISNAMRKRPATVFLANVSVETEMQQECLSLRICTIITGAAMERALVVAPKPVSRTDAPTATDPNATDPNATDPKATEPKQQPMWPSSFSPADETPSRVIKAR